MGKNGQLITFESPNFNGDTFRLFLEKLISQAKVGTKRNGKKKKLLLVLDNARYHHAKKLQPWLESVSDLMELFFLPAYSPDLNPIEILWKKTRRNVTHNRFFKSIQHLSYDLKGYWSMFERPNEELKSSSAFI
jgi:transposase